MEIITYFSYSSSRARIVIRDDTDQESWMNVSLNEVDYKVNGMKT